MKKLSIIQLEYNKNARSMIPLYKMVRLHKSEDSLCIEESTFNELNKSSYIAMEYSYHSMNWYKDGYEYYFLMP